MIQRRGLASISASDGEICLYPRRQIMKFIQLEVVKGWPLVIPPHECFDYGTELQRPDLPIQDQPLNRRRACPSDLCILSQGQRAKFTSILRIPRLYVTYKALSLFIPALEILPSLDGKPIGDFPFD